MARPLFRPLAVLSVVLGTLPVSNIVSGGGAVRHRYCSGPSLAALTHALGFFVFSAYSLYLVITEVLSGAENIGLLMVLFMQASVMLPLNVIITAAFLNGEKVARLIAACARLDDNQKRRVVDVILAAIFVTFDVLSMSIGISFLGWEESLACIGIFFSMMRNLVFWQMLAFMFTISDIFERISLNVQQVSQAPAVPKPFTSQSEAKPTVPNLVTDGRCWIRRNPANAGEVAVFTAGDAMGALETPPTSSSLVLSIQCLRQKYSAAAELVDLFNASYGIQILAFNLFMFGYTMRGITHNVGVGSDSSSSLLFVLDLTMNGMKTAALFLAGQKVATSAGRPLTLLTQQLTADPSAQLETIQAVQQLQTAQCQVTAAGFCSIDRRTLLSLAAAYVTYGVILVQMKS